MPRVIKHYMVLKKIEAYTRAEGRMNYLVSKWIQNVSHQIHARGGVNF